MPNRDKTGPLGQGPLTGRGLGPCGAGLARGRGFGFARWGRGRFCPAFAQAAPATEADEKKLLVQDLADLKDEEEAIKKRLKELKA